MRKILGNGCTISSVTNFASGGESVGESPPVDFSPLKLDGRKLREAKGGRCCGLNGYSDGQQHYDQKQGCRHHHPLRFEYSITDERSIIVFYRGTLCACFHLCSTARALYM